MSIPDKISEAAFFLRKLTQSCTADERTKSRYYLSAFLSSSRSSLQYIEDATKRDNKAKNWFKKQESIDIVFFFRKLRNTTIHSKQTNPKRILDLHISEDFATTDDTRLTEFAPTAIASKPANLLTVQNVSPQDKVSYTLIEDELGTNIIEKCNIYITKIRHIYEEGISLGHLIEQGNNS